MTTICFPQVLYICMVAPLCGPTESFSPTTTPKGAEVRSIPTYTRVHYRHQHRTIITRPLSHWARSNIVDMNDDRGADDIQLWRCFSSTTSSCVFVGLRSPGAITLKTVLGIIRLSKLSCSMLYHGTVTFKMT